MQAIRFLARTTWDARPAWFLYAGDVSFPTIERRRVGRDVCYTPGLTRWGFGGGLPSPQIFFSPGAGGKVACTRRKEDILEGTQRYPALQTSRQNANCASHSYLTRLIASVTIVWLSIEA